MDPRIHTSVGVNPQLHQRMVPKVMMVNRLLVLPLRQLLARSEQELGENRALELDEIPASPEPDWSSEESGQSLATWTSDDEEFDPFSRMAAPVSLQEHLMMTLQAQGLSARDHAIGERLIGYINENGYVEATTVQVAQETNAEVEEVEAVLGRIQRFEPVGVAARNVEECLLLQLRVMEPAPANRLAQRLVETHLADLAARRFEKVAKDLEVTIAEVKDAHEFVKANCYPYPGERYRSEQDGGRLRPAEVARADVIIRQTEDGFTVELCRRGGVAPPRNALYGDLRPRVRRAGARGSAQTRRHLRGYAGPVTLF